MNTLETNKNNNLFHKSYPQVEALFQSLNTQNQERNEIEKDFYNIAKIVYEYPQKIMDNNIIMQIKLGTTNESCLKSRCESDNKIIDLYLDFIKKYPNGAKIWRLLSAYYNPRKK